MKRKLASVLILIPLLVSCDDGRLKESAPESDVSLDGWKWETQEVSYHDPPSETFYSDHLWDVGTIMALFPQAVWNRQVSYQTKRTE